MSHLAEDLLRAVVRRMADGQRVLLNGTAFDTLAALADAPVRELVVVSEDADPDAPAGETAHGAPLRLRPDWRERPRSKDVILDPHGTAPADEVVRVLKKHGVYLSGVESPALDALACRRTLQPTRGTLLLLDVDDAAGATIEAALLAGDRDADPLTLFAAGHTERALPAAAVALAESGADKAELEAARAETADAEDRAEALAADLNAARVDAESQGARADAAEALAAARAAEIETLRSGLAAAEAAAETAQAARIARDAEFAELEGDYDAVRAELAERRVEDRRFESLRTRYEEARTAMTAEVQGLRDTLREVHAQSLDIDTVVAERNASRAGALRLVNRLADTIGRLAPTRRLPATPVPAPDDAAQAALDAWLESVEGATDAVAAELQSRREVEQGWIERGEALTARVRELDAALRAVTAEQAEAQVTVPSVPAPTDDALTDQIAALEQVLAAERALRAAEQAAHGRAIDAARAAEAVLDDLRATLAATRRAESAAALGKAAVEDELSRLQTEVQARARYADELEEAIGAHERMEGLLTAALHDARDRTELAEAARREAEANLRVLRAEFERLSG